MASFEECEAEPTFVEIPDFQLFKGLGQPSFNNRAWLHYYSNICSSVCNAMASKSQWVITIEPDNEEYLINSIKTVGEYEPRSGASIDWNISNSVDSVWNFDNIGRIGVIHASGITMPGESTSVGYAGAGETNYGFLKGPVSQNRVDPAAVQFVFKESNCSFTDSFLRPWSIITGYRGLVARPKAKSTKATIRMIFLARNNRSDLLIRKVVSLYGCSCISVNGEQADYAVGDTLIERQADFTYQHYSVNDFLVDASVPTSNSKTSTLSKIPIIS